MILLAIAVGIVGFLPLLASLVSGYRADGDTARAAMADATEGALDVAALVRAATADLKRIAA